MAMMSNWGMLSIRSERVATFLMDDCPHSASTTAHPPGAPSSPATQHIADVPTHRRPWRSVCNLHRCDDVADSQHTKAEDHRRGHRHVRSHRLHPRARVEADYNKANQDTRITSFPDVSGTELRRAAVARTLQLSCVKLLACQIEDKAMAIWSLCGRHAGHLSMSAFRSEPDPTRRSRPCIHKSSCRNFAPE